MSMHTQRAFAVAQRKGAWAGADYPQWNDLARLSKRELIEVALRLGAASVGHCDERFHGIEAFYSEYRALKDSGIL